MLCAGLALPAHAITAHPSVIPSAVTVTKETAYRGVFEAGAEAHTGLFCQADPVNNTDSSGNDIGEMLSVMEIGASLDALPNLTTIQGVASGLGTSGSDITKQLQATLDEVEPWFDRYSDEGKKDLCLRIVGKGPLGVGGAKNAWYIPVLANPTLVPGYTPPAGLDYGSGSSRPSVAVDGRCYHTYGANYALWGEIMKVAHDFMKKYGKQDDYTLDSAEGLAIDYKFDQYGITPFSHNVQEALAFTRYGYTGSKAGLPACSLQGVTTSPKDICTINGAFDWVWLPYRNPR
jgi:hypothetical protein